MLLNALKCRRGSTSSVFNAGRNQGHARQCERHKKENVLACGLHISRLIWMCLNWRRSAGAAAGGEGPAAGHALRVDVAAKQVDHARGQAAAARGDQHARRPAPLGLAPRRPRQRRPGRPRPRPRRCRLVTALRCLAALTISLQCVLVLTF